MLMTKKSRDRELNQLLKLLIGSLGITFIYVVSQLILSIRDWGDGRYIQQYDLLLHDQLRILLWVGISTGLYIAVVFWITWRYTRGFTKKIRRILLCILCIMSLGVAYITTLTAVHGVERAQSIYCSTTTDRIHCR